MPSNPTLERSKQYTRGRQLVRLFVGLLALSALTPACRRREGLPPAPSVENAPADPAFPESRGGTVLEAPTGVTVLGALRVWHTLELQFEGPGARETEETNPFTDFSLAVTFRQGNRVVAVPGFFAADGQAAQTGARAGTIWAVRWSPPSEGLWTWSATMRRGPDVVFSPQTGDPVAAVDGLEGRLQIAASDKKEPDLRATGRLVRVPGKGALRFEETDAVFVAGGTRCLADTLASPIFNGRPGCYAAVHPDFPQTDVDDGKLGQPDEPLAAHARDWSPSDPVWLAGQQLLLWQSVQGQQEQQEKRVLQGQQDQLERQDRESGRGRVFGRGLVGALNYLSETGVNALYLDIPGSGTRADCGARSRFNIAKLEQWALLVAHANRKGLAVYLGMSFQGELSVSSRRLLVRETVARFAHVPGLVFEVQAGDGLPAEILEQVASEIKTLDAYQHPVLVQLEALPREMAYAPLLGKHAIDGASFMAKRVDERGAYEQTLLWRNLSTAVGETWAVSAGNFGGPDQPSIREPVSQHNRVQWLWANIMAGGVGGAWPVRGLQDDLRKFDPLWQQTGHLVRFFRDHVQAGGLSLMDFEPRDDALSGNWVLSVPGESYVVLAKRGGVVRLDLREQPGPFVLSWFNPRSGALVPGVIDPLAGGSLVDLGQPPFGVTNDWVAWVRRPLLRGREPRPGTASDAGPEPEEDDTPVEPGRGRPLEPLLPRDAGADGRTDAAVRDSQPIYRL